MGDERTLAERVEVLETFLGEPFGDSVSEMLGRLLKKSLDLENSLKERMIEMLRIIDKVDELGADVKLLKLSSSSEGNSVSTAPRYVHKVPKPSPFNGGRDARELENFIWDMEQCFKVAGVTNDDQVTIASMYFAGEAKLWWRTRETEAHESDDGRITSWEELQSALRERFLPTDAAWMARQNLSKVRHTGSLQDYIKEFSSAMLSIRGMSEADKLYNFMSKLQGWAYNELRRLGCKDLKSAIAVADRLADFRTPSLGDKGKEERYGEDKGEISERVNKTSGFDEKTKRAGGNDNKCFICKGPHRAKFCPKRENLASITAEKGDSQSRISYVNSLQLLEDKPTRASGSSSGGGLLRP